MASKMVYELVIIGGGPGGLMAAAEAVKYGLKVVLLEKNDKPGKKLLVTGGGQCNLTHVQPMNDLLSHYHEKSKFAAKAIRKFPPQQLMKWLEDAGIELEVTEQGKVFPKSRRASDVLNALLRQISREEGRILCGVAVTSIDKEEGYFRIMSDKGTWFGQNLLISTGGQSYPSLGTTGDGYRLAERMGHCMVSVRPGLTALKINKFLLDGLAGISMENIPLTLWRNDKKVGIFQGDILITHDGISGPVVLNYARNFLPYDLLTMNLTKCNRQDAYQKHLHALMDSSGKKTVRATLNHETVPQRLMDRVLGLAGIPSNITCGNLSRNQRKQLIKYMTAFPMEIQRVKGFETAMVTAGGVATDEVVGTTMSSKLVKGLYFAGEVLDVDGMTGGYNLQFAFSSGFVAAAEVYKQVKIKGDKHEKC